MYFLTVVQPNGVFDKADIRKIRYKVFLFQEVRCLLQFLFLKKKDNFFETTQKILKKNYE